MKKLFIVAAALVALAAQAEKVEDKPELNGKPSEQVTAVRLANELIRFGYQNKSALAMAAGLEMMLDCPAQDLDAERTGEKLTKADQKAKPEAMAYEFDAVMKDAKEMAKADKNAAKVLKQLEADAKAASRGAVGGPKRGVHCVRAGSSDSFSITFVSGRLAEILVSGDGDTDLDLYVYDSNGNLIASDSDYTDDCYVSWIPAWTGKYTVKVVNRGGVYNRYVIATN